MKRAVFLGWLKLGASQDRGWQVLAMTSMTALQAVNALLAVQAKLAGIAVAATSRWIGTGLGQLPNSAGGSTT